MTLESINIFPSLDEQLEESSVTDVKRGRRVRSNDTESDHRKFPSMSMKRSRLPILDQARQKKYIEIPLVKTLSENVQSETKSILPEGRGSDRSMPSRFSPEQMERMLGYFNDWAQLPGYLMMSEDEILDVVFKVLEIRYRYPIELIAVKKQDFEAEVAYVLRRIDIRAERASRKSGLPTGVEVRRRIASRMELYLSVFKAEWKK